ncbi:MAG: hypothetical protein AAF678_13735, partial [Pseudomonadota bacterium]
VSSSSSSSDRMMSSSSSDMAHTPCGRRGMRSIRASPFIASLQMLFANCDIHPIIADLWLQIHRLVIEKS